MAISVTRIDDKSDGFTVDFTVTNTYRRTFPTRPEGRDQNLYARECVQGVVAGPVEKPEGVVVVPPQVTAVTNPNAVINLDPEPVNELKPAPTEPEPEQPIT